MDIQSILAIVFVVLLSVFLIVERKRIEVQKIVGPLVYFALMRTKIGLPFMDWCARKFRAPLKWAGYVGIVVGYAGMVFIAYSLIETTIKIFSQPESVAGVGLVLPIQAKGVFFVPFIYWILSLFIIIVIHEGSHGIWARVHNIPVKASGFAVFGVIVPLIPAAFVEPDEVKLPKKSKRAQLSVFAAGPFSNIVTGFVFLLILTQILAPMATDIYHLDGITVSALADGGAAELAGIAVDETINKINDVTITDGASLSDALGAFTPGDEIIVTTDVASYPVTLQGDGEVAKLGVNIEQHRTVRTDYAGGAFGAAVYDWFAGLFYWLFLLSLGIGLFNLVPLGPIDGGRMFKIATDTLFKRNGDKIFGLVSWLFLGLILLNIGAGFFL